MNHYPKHTGDYIRDTVGLSMLEDGAYTRLLDQYYVTERALPLERQKLYRMARAASGAERKAVDAVIAQFFVLLEDGYHQRRADRELAEIYKRSESARESAAAKWRDRDRAAAHARSERLSAARKLGSHVDAEWRAMLRVFGGLCVRCGAAGAVRDHIVPIYQGGSDSIENLQPLCHRCNSSKGPDSTDWRAVRLPTWRDAYKNACEMPADALRDCTGDACQIDATQHPLPNTQEATHPHPSGSDAPQSNVKPSATPPAKRPRGNGRGERQDGARAPARPPSGETWDAYSAAYVARYGTPPARNATVNGQIANLVARLGALEAPQVAAWYVGVNTRRYVERQHPVGLLLHDAEGLRTGWATRRIVTETEARQADRTQATGNVFGKLIEEAKAANA